MKACGLRDQHGKSKAGASMDELEIRPGRLEDVAGVREFTQNTFHWGDYVADVFPA